MFGVDPYLERSMATGQGTEKLLSLCYKAYSENTSCYCWVASVVSDSMWPHRWQPTRLLCLWDSPGKNTGMGCHFLLQCMKVKSEREVAQLWPTLRDPMDCSLPGSSVHGIFQARVLEWGAIAFSLPPGIHARNNSFHLSVSRIYAYDEQLST